MIGSATGFGQSEALRPVNFAESMGICGIPLVSSPVNTLLDPPAHFRAGQGAPTRQKCKRRTGEEAQRRTGEEAQRRPARKDAAQRVRY
jgi:hypothetical protein